MNRVIIYARERREDAMTCFQSQPKVFSNMNRPTNLPSSPSTTTFHQQPLPVESADSCFDSHYVSDVAISLHLCQMANEGQVLRPPRFLVLYLTRSIKYPGSVCSSHSSSSASEAWVSAISTMELILKRGGSEKGNLA